MPIDFFEKELERVQRNFNRAYGGLKVINLKHRESIILAIVHMGLLSRSVKKAENDLDRQIVIKRFIRVRNSLNRQFIQMKKERRQHGNSYSDGHQRQTNDGDRNDGRNRKHLQVMR